VIEELCMGNILFQADQLLHVNICCLICCSILHFTNGLCNLVTVTMVWTLCQHMSA